MRAKFLELIQTVREYLGVKNKDGQLLSGIPLHERLKVALAAFISLWVVSATSKYFVGNTEHIILLASMGASAVLLFGLSSSPLAKPWSFVGGHLISAFIGLICSMLIDDFALAAAVTIAIVLLAMYSFECMHPPGGATALVPVISQNQGLGLEFMMAPVALNVILMLILAILLNKFLVGRSLIGRKAKKFDPIHLHNDLSPLKRLGLQQEDLLYALNDFQTVVDISESDLEVIYQRAQLHAYQRDLGNIKCSDIMSRDLITVSPTTPIAKAWGILKKHKIRTLPVVNDQYELIGVVSITDFLKDVKVPHYWGVVRHIVGIGILQDAKRRWKKAKTRSVASIMSINIQAINESEHIIDLIPKLSDLGLHQIPVLNDEQRLVGIVTQSDLIASLYANRNKVK